MSVAWQPESSRIGASALTLLRNGTAAQPQTLKGAEEGPVIRRIADVPDVSAMEARPIEFVIDGLIARSAVTLMSGDAGCGKSTMLTAISGAIVGGADFAGFSTEPSPVLYLDRENTLPVVQERLKRLGVATGPYFKYWGSWLPEEAPAIASPIVIEYITESDPKPLVVIDSLVSFHDGSENDSTETRAFLNEARKLANLGAAVVLLHHSGKAESAKEYRGSSDIKASVDVAFHLSNLSDGRLGRLRLKAFKTRFTVHDDLILRYSDGVFTCDDRPNAVNATVTDRLIELLRDNPGVRVQEFQKLAVTAGLGRNRAYSFLKGGVKLGTVREEAGANNSKLHYFADKEDQDYGLL